MSRYLSEIKKEFEFSCRRAYPPIRHDFRPAAYVVLTRDGGFVTEEVHG